ncbi:MAG: hypothetical protein C4524_04470 [Candidatus Zixiibacteriota bacterium]|nr:MAG: hypothetical protein C4524_04470 [candidate division Zixibacteria bacterium]
MPIAQVTGLASGIQWQQTVDLLMQIESQPKVALEERRDEYEQKLAAWQDINSKLLNLKSIMEEMNELDEVLFKAATSSDGDVLTASATSEAATGSYTVLVNQLALNDKWTEDNGVPDVGTTDLTVAPATFSYTYGDEAITMTVPANTTLSELVQLINSDVENPGVTATILNDGSGTNSYHLVLTGNDSGTSNAITGISHTLDNFTSSFINTQTAQNAMIRVDGYPSTGWIESDSNDVDEVIDGVTLHLKTTTATPVTVTVSNDTEGAEEKIQDFVTAYNQVITLINSKTSYDAETETAGVLFGDGRVIGIKNDLQAIIASEVPGLAENAAFTSLSEIGIKSGAGGILSVTSTKLQDALSDNFDAVGDLFALTHSSDNNALTYFLSNALTQGGTFNVAAQYDDQGALVSATINGNPAQIDGSYIIGAAGGPEEGLRVKFTWPGGGAGSVSAEINLAKGDAVRLADRISFLTDPIDGTVHFATEGVQDTIDSIDDQIETWEARLETKRAQLEREFLAMETLISQLQGQGNYVSAMIAGM